MKPSQAHLPVVAFIHPDQFAEYKTLGEQMGFKAVFSGPFVRSSYLADELIEGLSPSFEFKKSSSAVPENFTV